MQTFNSKKSRGWRLSSNKPFMKSSRPVWQSIPAGLAGLLVSWALFAAPDAQAAGPKGLQFTAGALNTSGHITILDHPSLNGKASLKLILTQSLVPGSSYNHHPVGLHYDLPSKHWQVVDEDLGVIPFGTIFNILIAPGAKRVNAGPQNSIFNWTFFTLQKGKPNAVLLASHIDSPYPSLGGFNPVNHNLGVYYIPATSPATPGTGVWALFNEDQSPALAAAYNVLDVTKDAPRSFVLTSSASNILSNAVSIDNPVTNNNPNAVVFATVNYNPGGLAPIYHNRPIGVVYFIGKWFVVNLDGAGMQVGAHFNVDVFAAPTP